MNKLADIRMENQSFWWISKLLLTYANLRTNFHITVENVWVDKIYSPPPIMMIIRDPSE